MRYSILHILGFILLFATIVALVISIVTSWWTSFALKLRPGVYIHRGLLEDCFTRHYQYSESIGEPELICGEGPKVERCESNEMALEIDRHLEKHKEYLCKFRLEEMIMNPNDIFDSVWELACLSLMSLSFLLTVIGLFFAPCCVERCSICLSNIILSSALCTFSGVSTYAWVHVHSWNKFQYLGYSFWIAVGAGGGQLLSFCIFIIVSCCQTQRDPHEYRAVVL